jgi:hypothetical protein
MQPASSASAPVPVERYYRASEALFVLAPARRLAILDVLSRRGPLLLGVANFEAGVGTQWALRDAAEMEKAGLVTVKRPTGRNLSCTCEITPSGSRALELAGMWAD